MQKLDDRPIAFWSCSKDDEYLVHETIEEAVQDYINAGCESNDGLVEVYGFARVVPSRFDCGSPLEYVLERLDEDYVNPHTEGTIITDKMREAETKFIDAIIREYQSWMCDCTVSTIVNIADYTGVDR